MPTKPADSEWLTYYRWAIGALLAIVTSMVGYFGTTIKADQAWVHDQVIMINERGTRNREDIMDMRNDAKMLRKEVSQIQVKLDRIDGRMP